MKNLIVIDTPDNNWYEIFADQINNEELNVEQSTWEDSYVTSYTDGAYVELYPAKDPISGTKQNQKRMVKPDFLLIRNLVVSWVPDCDYRNMLYGLMYANIPAINSLKSIYMCLERPLLFSGLKRIKTKLGDKFPLIDQTYYSYHAQMIITPPFPIVTKVGNAHAGMGKMRVTTNDDLDDLKSIIGLNKHYVTAEPYYENAEYDIRIKKIGNHYRAYKRTAYNWKRNVGGALLEEIPVTSEYKLWVDECSKLFGGLDILALDALHLDDGTDIIIELNDTAMGLNPEHKIEDMGHIKNIVLQKMGD
jgi:hypothetical protein